MPLLIRKIYLHLQDDRNPITFKVSRCPEVVLRARAATLALTLYSGREKSNVWVNGDRIILRRDVFGYYLADYRSVEISDRIVCTREQRYLASLARRDIGFCQWRPIDDDDD